MVHLEEEEDIAIGGQSDARNSLTQDTVVPEIGHLNLEVPCLRKSVHRVGDTTQFRALLSIFTTSYGVRS